MDFDLNQYWNTIYIYIANYALKVILAIVILLVGFRVIRHIIKLIRKSLTIRNVDQSLHSFITSISNILLKTLLILSVIAILGIDTSSFVAALAAAGFAIGMALQGSLSNFAGGVLILFFKPFKVGEYIEAQGFNGEVKYIHIFNTEMVTPDNKIIFIPNGPLAGGPIINYTRADFRRVDFTFGISYGDDIQKARNVIFDVVSSDERIHKDPLPFIGVGKLNDYSVDLTVRVWTKTSDYWDVFFSINEKIKIEFDSNSITIPYPQRNIIVNNG